MVSIVETDGWKRLQRFRNDLVLDLFLRRGAFWERLAGVRHFWGVHPLVGLPPPRTLATRPGAFGPPGCPQAWSFIVETLGEELLDRWLMAMWRQTVDDLCAQTVPECFAPESEQWLVFFEHCLLYDPPEDRLLDYAALGDLAPFFPLVIQQSEEGAPASVRSGPPHLGLPIVYKAEASHYEDHERRYWWRVMEGLIERLWERQHVDPESTRALLKEVQADPELVQWYHQLTPELTPQPFIQVSEETTKADVARAVEVLRETFGWDMKSGRPSIDPLEAVQCTILHERYGWGEARLAERFGFPLTNDDYGTPRRSNPARSRLDLGRTILGRENTLP